MVKMKNEVYAKEKIIGIYNKSNIFFKSDEIEKMEITDFGLEDFFDIGLGVIIYINTKRVCAKELAMTPFQICPQHRHPNLDGGLGKEETFRCRWGEVYLYVSGTEAKNDTDAKDDFKRRAQEYNKAVEYGILEELKKLHQDQRAWLKQKFDKELSIEASKKLRAQLTSDDLSKLSEDEILKALPNGKYSPGRIPLIYGGIPYSCIQYNDKDDKGGVEMAYDPRMQSHREGIARLSKQAGLKKITISIGSEVTAVGGNPYGTFHPGNDPKSHKFAIQQLDEFIKLGFFDHLKDKDFSDQNLPGKIKEIVDIKFLFLTPKALERRRQLIMKTQHSFQQDAADAKHGKYTKDEIHQFEQGDHGATNVIPGHSAG